MKILKNKYPLGSLPGQKTPGRYIDGILHQNIKILAKNITKDMTYLGIISSSTLEVGTGKCQPKGSKVLMANGKWKNIEDIKVGDKIISPNIKKGKSEIANVKEIDNYFSKDNYAIHKRWTGEKLYECSGNHLIPIIMRKRKNKNGQYRGTETIIDNIPTNELYKKNKAWFWNESVSTFQGFFIDKFQDSKDPEIDPYSLGLFIGDGHFRSKKNPIRRCVGITSADSDSINYVLKKYPAIRIEQKMNNKAKTYMFSLKSNFVKLLSEMGLEGKCSGDKFIPYQAKKSSSNYRLKLLAGLIDSDGFVDKRGMVSYTTKSETLAKDVIELCRSLGGNSNIKKIKKGIKSTGFVGEYFNVQINLGLNQGKIPLINKFKKNRLKEKSMLGYIHFWIKRIEPKEVFGLVLDNESKLYITDNFCVTHNSVFVQQLSEAYLNEVNKKHGFNLKLTMNNIVFRPQDIIKRSFQVPQYSIIICDEWEDANYWSELGTTLRQFFRKCRQLNLFILIIIPNFFQLPMSYAISRSVFFIDVRFSGEFDRGYFSFYNFAKKKTLYLKGKKQQNYGVMQPNFTGRFGDGYVVNKKEYLKCKRKDLEHQEELEKKPMTERDMRSVIFRKIFHHFKGVDMRKRKLSITELSKAFGFAETTGRAYLKDDEKNIFKNFEKDNSDDSRHNIKLLTSEGLDGGEKDD